MTQCIKILIGKNEHENKQVRGGGWVFKNYRQQKKCKVKGKELRTRVEMGS